MSAEENPESHSRNDSPSHYVNKMRGAPTDYLHNNNESSFANEQTTRIEHYFFYSKLASSKTLARTLGTTEIPELRAAEINGYHVCEFEGNKAIVSGHETVTGYAALIANEAEEQKLDVYRDRGAFEPTICRIILKDSKEPREVPGRVFTLELEHHEDGKVLVEPQN